MLRTKTSTLFILAGLFWLVTAALAAQPADGGAVIFPVVLTADANDSGFFETTLHLMNLSNTTTTVEVAAFSNRQPDAIVDREEGPAPLKIIALEPQEAVRIPFRRVGAGPGLRESWAAVRTLEGRANAAVRLTDVDFERNGSPRAPSDVLVAGVRPARQFRAFAAWDGLRGCAPTSQSAYAIVNPSRTEPAEVTLRFFEHTDAGADRLHEAQLRIPPLGRTTAILGGLFDIFPDPGQGNRCGDVPVRGEGIVNVSSETPVAVEVLQVNLRNGHFYNLPSQAVPRPVDGAEDTAN